MKKHELVAKVAQDTGLSKVVSAAALESVLHGIVLSLKKGQTVTLVGFGTFKASQRVARFSAGKGLKDAINKT
jgi:nucleoid DNA-binding protein